MGVACVLLVGIWVSLAGGCRDLGCLGTSWWTNDLLDGDCLQDPSRMFTSGSADCQFTFKLQLVVQRGTIAIAGQSAACARSRFSQERIVLCSIVRILHWGFAQAMATMISSPISFSPYPSFSPHQSGRRHS